ncbi:MAG: TetR/AcrR family transcriptional regulator [Gluconacetobacter diazotrophicus]|nr:TetR/AcrR family transcriptional regulator [Gluconacetobacter diazotrophicus]
MTAPNMVLKPRKSPVQARSAVTVEALHVATIQVLTTAGLKGCTTTRVAARAGVSVGTLYQYYPNRDALLAGLLSVTLGGLADAVDLLCARRRGEDAAAMGRALVDLFVDMQLTDADQQKALYAVAAGLGGPDIIAHVHRRMVAAIAEMIGTARDVRIEEPVVVAAVVLNAIVGAIRAVLEGHAPDGYATALRAHLATLAAAYLGRWPGDRSPTGGGPRD